MSNDFVVSIALGVVTVAFVYAACLAYMSRRYDAMLRRSKKELYGKFLQSLQQALTSLRKEESEMLTQSSRTLVSPPGLCFSRFRKALSRHLSPCEFYLSHEIPYSRLEGFLTSALEYRRLKPTLIEGRIRQSQIERILKDYFADKAGRIMKGIRPLPAAVWFSIEDELAVTGDQAQLTIHIATQKYRHMLPCLVCFEVRH